MSQAQNIKLDEFSIPELQELLGLASAELEKKIETRRQELREEWRRKAEAEGLRFENIVSARERSRRPSQPQYRNPDDPSQVWSGRGRKPRWLKKIQAGPKIDES